MDKTKTNHPTPLAILEALRDTDVNDLCSAETLRQSYCVYCAAAYGNPRDERLVECRKRRCGLFDQTELLAAQVFTLGQYLELSGPPETGTPFMLKLLNTEMFERGALVPGLTLNPASGNLGLSFLTPTLRAALYAALLTAVAIHHGEIMFDATTTTGADAKSRVTDTRLKVDAVKIARAQKAINEEGKSLRAAAHHYKIKPSTLSDHLRRVRKPTIPDTLPPGRAKKWDVDS